MITQEQFSRNFENLRASIPKKPLYYTAHYPRTIDESFKLYSNSRTRHLLCRLTNLYNLEQWPLPLWIDPTNVKISLINKLNYQKATASLSQKKSVFDWIPIYSRFLKHNRKIKGRTDFWQYLMFPAYNQIFFKQDFTEGIVKAFDVNLLYVKRKLIDNPILRDRQEVIEAIFSAYKQGYWLACLNTIFPLLDRLARQHLKVSSLKNDIKGICKLFKKCGIDADSTDILMPIVHYGKEIRLAQLNGKPVDWNSSSKQTIELGLLGPILSSFLLFANKYYSYYKDENEKIQELNRHAVIHGAVIDVATKENTVRLLTFLVLFIELEPVFRVLFNNELDLLDN